ncbi:MAG: ABC transporter ATP-binding protein [Bacteroidota bacterium]
MDEILIEIKIKKNIFTTNGNEVLDVDISIPKNGFITFFGKSGVGKTTILRILAGLTKPDSGFIKVGNEVWFDSFLKINLKPQFRNIGFVFQDYALFPNMSVKEQLLFAQPTQDSKYVSELLDVFHLKGLCNRKPNKLSGGQQQRLAVARALARKPEILLLDEPLSALDSETRLVLQNEIFQAHKNFNTTTILVSHDINEVLKLSDYVYIIDNGKIKKHGMPNEIFNIAPAKTKTQIIGKIINIENNVLTISNNEATINITADDSNTFKINDKIIISTLETNINN